MTQFYIFDFGNRIKIDKSNRVRQRLKAIENSSGEKAVNVFSIESDSNIEMLMHHRLQQYRTIGEYFNCSFEKAKEIMLDISAGKTEYDNIFKRCVKREKNNLKLNSFFEKQIRINEIFMDKLKKTADNLGMNVSEYVRLLILEDVRKSFKPGK